MPRVHTSSTWPQTLPHSRSVMPWSNLIDSQGRTLHLNPNFYHGCLNLTINFDFIRRTGPFEQTPQDLKRAARARAKVNPKFLFRRRARARRVVTSSLTHWLSMRYPSSKLALCEKVCPLLAKEMATLRIPLFCPLPIFDFAEGLPLSTRVS